MKTDINNVASQIIFQGLRTLASIILIGGIAILFVQDGTGVLVQSWDHLADASNLLANFAG